MIPTTVVALDRAPSVVFFKCYRCAEPTMSITPFGVYCQGCGLRSFTDHTEERIQGVCGNGHPELVQSTSSRIRCLVCSHSGGYAQ